MITPSPGELPVLICSAGLWRCRGGNGASSPPQPTVPKKLNACFKRELRGDLTPAGQNLTFSITKDRSVQTVFDKMMVPATLLVRRGISSNYKKRRGRTDRRRETDPLGGNLSSCSGCAWPAKRSRHLIVSFCTEALRGPAAKHKQRGRGEEEERAKDDTNTQKLHEAGCPTVQTEIFSSGWVCVGGGVGDLGQDQAYMRTSLSR